MNPSILLLAVTGSCGSSSDQKMNGIPARIAALSASRESALGDIEEAGSSTMQEYFFTPGSMVSDCGPIHSIFGTSVSKDSLIDASRSAHRSRVVGRRA